MINLELKVPPPVVAVLVALAMRGLWRLGPVLDLPATFRHVAAFMLAATGIATAVSGVIGFRRARTTLRPENPEKTSALVTGGIYRITRNPMYLGLVLVLTAWALALAAPWTLLGPAFFALYIQRFQIRPEERVLAAKFGGAYARYCDEVRRWI